MRTLFALGLMLAVSPALAYDSPWDSKVVDEIRTSADGKTEYRVSTFFRGKTRLLTIVDTYWPGDGSARGRIQYLYFKGNLAYTEITNFGSSNSTLVHFFAESGAGVSLDDKEGDGRVDHIGLTDEKGALWAVFERGTDGLLAPLDMMAELKSEDIKDLPVAVREYHKDLLPR